jgi:FlaA1/EpsC-like NDP-sugar epimerase
MKEKFKSIHKQLLCFFSSNVAHRMILGILIVDLCILLTEHVVLIVRFHDLQHFVEHNTSGTEYKEGEWVHPLENALAIMTYTIVVIFMLELVGKIIAFGSGYFRKRWNILDAAVIVVAFAAEVALPFLLAVYATEIVSLVLPLRIIRLLRFTATIAEANHESDEQNRENKKAKKRALLLVGQSDQGKTDLAATGSDPTVIQL